MESAGDHFSCCSFCLTASPPDSLATVDHEGLFMYCPKCISLSSQHEDLSSHAQSSTSAYISPLNLNATDSFATHDPSFSPEHGSTSVCLSAELGSFSVFDVSTELGSSSPELSQSAPAAGTSPCTSCDAGVTLAPAAGDLYGLPDPS